MSIKQINIESTVSLQEIVDAIICLPELNIIELLHAICDGTSFDDDNLKHFVFDLVAQSDLDEEVIGELIDLLQTLHDVDYTIITLNCVNENGEALDEPSEVKLNIDAVSGIIEYSNAHNMSFNDAFVALLSEGLEALENAETDTEAETE